MGRIFSLGGRSDDLGSCVDWAKKLRDLVTGVLLSENQGLVNVSAWRSCRQESPLALKGVVWRTEICGTARESDGGLFTWRTA